jgi:nicotinamidase-related amidase
MKMGWVSEVPGPAGADLELCADQAGLVLVDWQERLLAAMAPEIAERAVQNVLILVEAARRLAMPVIASEQYPQGLGKTAPEIAQALGSIAGVVRFEKTQFGCCGLEPFDRALETFARPQWIVSGMETHVCVYQTVRRMARNRAVFVPQDAVLSRSKENWRMGLALAARAGCVITSTETVVFDLLKRSGGEDFKALAKLVK